MTVLRAIIKAWRVAWCNQLSLSILPKNFAKEILILQPPTFTFVVDCICINPLICLLLVKVIEMGECTWSHGSNTVYFFFTISICIYSFLCFSTWRNLQDLHGKKFPFIIRSNLPFKMVVVSSVKWMSRQNEFIYFWLLLKLIFSISVASFGITVSICDLGIA